ncbi:MAG: hypothetical protein R3F49_04020 [Planctomycetota bacterium]
MTRSEHSLGGRTSNALAGLLCLVCAAPADAQRSREEDELFAERAVLQQRGRPVLHPGEPLQLIGVGEGDSEVLSRTPALADATLGLVRVDRDELRARKVALYEGGATFDSPPRSSAATRPDATAEPKARQRSGPDPAAADARDKGSTRWPWIVIALAFGAYVAARVAAERLGRRARGAPQTKLRAARGGAR